VASVIDSVPDSSPSSPERGRLFVIAGPSGVGKSTIVRSLRQRLTLDFSVSATTRPQRLGEVDGVNYHFVDVPEFERLVLVGAFLEWAQYGRHFYGTLQSEVEGRLQEGHDVILEIDIQGARQVKARYPNAFMVFVAPPSISDLEARLRARGDTTEGDIERRVGIAAQEMAEAPGLFDAMIVNADIDRAIQEVAELILDPVGRPIEPGPEWTL
jgi:guanylate kinase